MAPYKTRGIMLDPARLMERKEYYFALLPWLKEWGYNLLHMHVTDDEGCTLVFPSCPEIAHPHAFTPDEMRELIRRAGKLGIEVVPEIESLGHTRFITGHPKHRYLGGKGDGGFNAILPDHPDTRKILRGLIRDAAAIFDSPLIHLGLDEVDFSVLPKYKRVPKEEHWKIFAKHAAWAQEEVRRAGRRPAMWGDHILASPPMAKSFAKDVLVFDWHYHAPLAESSLKFFAESPFEFWGAPATFCYDARVVPNRTTIANLREFSARGLAYRGKGMTGIVNTVWCGYRFLPGAVDLGLAFAGHLFSRDRECPKFPAYFAREFYGLGKGDGEAAGRAIWRLYEAAPSRAGYERALYGSDWNAQFSRDDERIGAEVEREATAIAADLARVLPKARRNADRLAHALLSARAVAAMGAFAASGRRKVRAAPRLLRECKAAWARCRYMDEPRLKGALGRLDRAWNQWMLHGLRNI